MSTRSSSSSSSNNNNKRNRKSSSSNNNENSSNKRGKAIAGASSKAAEAAAALRREKFRKSSSNNNNENSSIKRGKAIAGASSKAAEAAAALRREKFRKSSSNNNNENSSNKRGKAIAGASSKTAAAAAAAAAALGGEKFPRPKFRDAKTLASTLLSWLPPHSTNNTKDSRLLLQAMDLVRAKLDHNTQLMAQSSIKDGRQSDIIITKGRVTVPPDVLMNILSYLKPSTELVHVASLVAKSWLAVTRSPQLWHTLDNDHGIPANSETNVTNMNRLLELLQRPQFASLKTLVPPDKVQLRAKAPGQIAKCCPLLENMDLGFSLWSNMKLDDKALLQLPTVFPHLNAIGFNTYRITDSGIRNFCGVMGDRLVSLRIRETEFGREKNLSDETLIQCISQHCPNLEKFDYEYTVPSDYLRDNPRPTVSDNGVIALLDGCPKLKYLSLIAFPVLGKSAFQHLVNNITTQNMNKDLCRLYVVGNASLMNDDELCQQLNNCINSFDAITEKEHSNRITAKRRANKIHNDW